MNQADSPVKENNIFRLRLISSIIAVPIVAVLIWFGAPWFTAFAAVWGLGGAYEFYSIVKRSRNLAPLTYFGLLWVVLLIISPHLTTVAHFGTVTPSSLLLTSAVVLPLIFLLWRRGKENAFANWAWTVGGILYIGWLLSYMVALRNIDDGRGWVFLAILCTFSSDSFAYLTGRSFGKHKMAPFISPKKTWEGAAGGAIAAVAASIFLVWIFNLPVNYWLGALLGFLVSLMGQLGDLVKSLFKRNMEVKDSGNVLPGHGGFLDRMDSLAFAGVTVFFFVMFIS
ncbi:MAG TPA: phosphatidate cytidylyltransferase [Dehalococcoidales bacterium]